MKPGLLLFLYFLVPVISFSQGLGKNDKLFTLLDPGQTHVYFNNEIVDTKEHNILIYSNYYGGGGVGIGDINHDGLPDIYFAGNLVGDRLYLNKGNMVFEDITESAGILDNGGWSSGVLFGDVNQDGFLDIYVTRELYDDQPELRRNKLYINNGNPSAGHEGVTFTECAAKYGVDSEERTRHATFLDYDNDGDLDLYLLNQPPNPGDYSPYYGKDLLLDQYSPRLYENTGQTFSDVTQKAGLLKPGFANSVSASDLNGDGWTDLYVTNDFYAPDFIYFNNGNGTFTEKVHEATKHISYYSMGVDAGDINNDGRLDVMTVDMVAEDNYRLKANMSGMDPTAFWKVVRDGGHYQYMFNTLQLNTSPGVGNKEVFFSDIAQLANVASTDWSWTTLIADLDNDGWKDIYVTNGLLRDIRNSDAAKKFPKYIESEISKFLAKNPNPEGVSIWDIADVNKALNFTPSVKLLNYAYQNKGNLTFDKVTEDWGFEEKTFSNGAAYADLDNDGDLDLVVSNVNDIASIYENNANTLMGNRYLRVNLLADDKAVSNLGVKVWIETKEGKQFFETTSVRGMYSTSELMPHFGLGKNQLVNKLRVRWPDGKENILENVKADQTLEVRHSEAAPPADNNEVNIPPLFENVTALTGINARHVENEFDDFEKQVLLPHKMSNMGPGLAAGDVNGDGLDDFYMGGAAGFEGHLYLQNADGTFREPENKAWAIDKVCEDMGAAFFDADGDQDLDLYVVSGGNEFAPDAEAYQDRLYINEGSGHFTKAEKSLPKIHASGSKVYPEDFDQDGDLDLFVAGRHVPWSYPEPASSYLLVNEGGHFVDATRKIAKDLKQIGMVNDASWVDFNNDGLKDLVLVGEWMPVTLLQNDGTQFTNVTEAYHLAESTGWWFSVAAADIDQDGDQDLIAGNLGLNYKYKASEEEPFEVYYGDFDSNGSKDIVLAYYNFGTQFPLRGRSCSSQQVPMLKEKFDTYDLFASSDLVKVYGENNIEKSLNYKANTFASVYLENKGNGQFEMHPLPSMAQLSSVNDILIEDFNGDQHLDVLIGGNLYSSEVETPRNDAGYGLLLTGDGQGQFTPVTNLESGFFIPYDVKSMVELNSPKGKLILAGCNNDTLQIFKVPD